MKSGLRKGQKRSRMRQLMLVTMIAAVAVISIVILSMKQSQLQSSQEWIVQINDERVDREEWMLHAFQQRSALFAYFKKQYGADPGLDFWDTRFGQETPRSKLKELVLPSLVRTKVEQIWSKQLGLMTDISYPKFLDELEAENQRRQQAVSKGQAIYGPVAYDERGYYNYLHSNRLIQLKDKLAGASVKPTEQELWVQYEKAKERFKKSNVDSFHHIVIAEGDGSGLIAIQQAVTRLQQGESFEKLLAEVQQTAAGAASRLDEVMDESTMRSDTELRPQVRETVDKLAVNGISDVVKESGSYHLVKLIERKPGAYQSFNDVRDLVAASVVEDKFKAELSKRIAEAKVSFNESVYASLPLQ